MSLCKKILPSTAEGMLRTVAVLLVEDCAPFEFGVICEVFGIDRTEEGVPAVRLPGLRRAPRQAAAA